jgi:hypothetical protein
MSDRFDEVQINEATIKRQTDNAALYEIEGKEVWIPWSQVANYHTSPTKDGETGPIFVKRWLAEEKELEYEEL